MVVTTVTAKEVFGVYLVGGPKHSLNSFLDQLDKILKTGIRIFQLRVKEGISDGELLALAKEVRILTRRVGALFIINDRPDLVVLADADGLHLGPQDLPVTEARKIIGRKILGISNHTFEQLLAHRDLDVDYFSLGPIYPTTSKKIPDEVVGLSFIGKCLPLLPTKPVVAIGGIGLNQIPEVLNTGVSAVGVISGIFSSSNPEEAAKKYVEVFHQNYRKGNQ